MKDRVSTYPGRVKLTPVSGQANTYDVVRADQPTQEGTPLNKTTLLTNETAAKIGLTSDDPTVDDALKGLASLLANGTTIITCKTANGDPLEGVSISGLLSPAGNAVTTDESGRAIVICTADTVVTFVSKYADIPDFEETVHPTTEGVGRVTITMPFLGAGEIRKFTTSQTLKFFEDQTIDVCCVGGGGGGGSILWQASTSSMTYSGCAGGGGGGEIANSYGIGVIADTEYELVVGSGGSSGASSTSGKGDSGGTTSFVGVSAAGGNGGSGYSGAKSTGSYSGGAGGVGGGKGGAGQSVGAAATVAVLGAGIIAGGGGGGGTASTSTPRAGGSPNGGAGGAYTSDSNTRVPASAGGIGGGGGGAALTNQSGSSIVVSAQNAYGGNGGSGAIYIRLSEVQA